MELRFTNLKSHKAAIASTLLAIIFAAPGTWAQQSTRTVNVGLVYPISTNGSAAASDTNSLSINLLAGLSAAEDGFAFAGFSNIVKHHAKGMQFAGFSNHIGGMADGITIAGFINTYQEARGLQVAGFTNVASDSVRGAQISGFLNRASRVDGVQIAGFANVAKDVVGPQLSGFSNVANNIKGSQTSGFVNTARDIDGSQIAGFINVARKVRGSQIAGFINIADSSDHPIGLINIIKNGEQSIAVTYDETRTGMLSFRSGGRVLYGILGIGHNFENKDEIYAAEAGLGAHVVRTNAFRMKAEASTMMLESFRRGEYFRSSVRLLPSLRPTRSIELFGGPSFNFVTTNTVEGRALVKDYIDSWTARWNSNFNGIYIGYTAGLNILF